MNNKPADYTTWDTSQLEETQTAIEKALAERRVIQEKDDALNRNINGITGADFVVLVGSLYQYGWSKDDHIRYTFCIKRGEKLYDIYYENGFHEFQEDDKTKAYRFHEWWPAAEPEIDEESGLPCYLEFYGDNLAYLFIPPGFAEASENCYSFTGTEEEAVAKLEEYGITDIRDKRDDEDGPDGE